MIYKHQQAHDPLLGTLWGLPTTSTLLYLVMSYIEAGQVAEKDNLTNNLSKTIQSVWENQVTI